MNLSEATAQYVAMMNASGYAFVNQACTLSAFCRSVADPQLGTIQADDLISYLDRRNIARTTWRNKYATLRRFFEFWCCRELMPPLELAPPRPKVGQAFMPYVYSREEMQRLLDSAALCQASKNCCVTSATLRVLLLTLYGTGARLGEVLSLKTCDLDATTTTLNISRGRGVHRKLPLNHDLGALLICHLETREVPCSKADLLFAGRGGNPIPQRTLRQSFVRLCRTAQVQRRYAREFKPRLNDFRTTFAVHRITSWIRNGDNLNRMLPALAVYMGHASLTATEQYLHRTPERFREHLELLSP